MVREEREEKRDTQAEWNEVTNVGAKEKRCGDV
jgi:hypothetical protein